LGEKNGKSWAIKQKKIGDAKKKPQQNQNPEEVKKAHRLPGKESKPTKISFQGENSKGREEGNVDDAMEEITQLFYIRVWTTQKLGVRRSNEKRKKGGFFRMHSYIKGGGSGGSGQAN